MSTGSLGTRPGTMFPNIPNMGNMMNRFGMMGGMARPGMSMMPMNPALARFGFGSYPHPHGPQLPIGNVIYTYKT